MQESNEVNKIDEFNEFFDSKIRDLKREFGKFLTDENAQVENTSIEPEENDTSARSVKPGNMLFWPLDQAASLTPAKFNGLDVEYPLEAFKFSVESYLENGPSIPEGLIDDYDKIGWIGNLLSGEPSAFNLRRSNSHWYQHV